MEKNKRKGKPSGRRWIHYLITTILLITMLISAAMAAKYYLEGRRAEEEYRRLAELAEQTTEAPISTEPEITAAPEPETGTPYISPINFEELTVINPDTVGWIRIPDTNIDYPIVQTDNNDTYLHTDFNGEESVYGSIYLDYESDSDLMGRNNILYGHHMKNGSMFKDIVKYKEEQYFKDHQFFEIYTPERTIKLKAVSCYYAKADAKVRQTLFATEEEFQEFVKELLKPCTFAEIPDEPVTELYTLVTCSYEVDDARTFLYAVEVKQ